jgi:type I restriction enzyme S subunit
MSDTPPIEVDPEQWAIILAILDCHVPDVAVVAFGSRARFQAKPYSDLDLALQGEGAIPLATLASLEHAFSESALPFRVDVVDWHGISETFRRAVAADRVIVRPSCQERKAQ